MTMFTPMSARQIVERIAQRTMTVESVVRACLERVAEREATVGAWTFLNADAVLAEARRLDAAGIGGALAGVPLGVKDLIDTVEYPTAYGSPIYAGHRPAWDAACVARARAAGALVLGKTVTTEFATYFPGKTANPHDPRATPGGSSSGSAAAVADGMVPLAYGTQTAASVIRPAAYCGVVGFKPSFGRISRAGVKSLAESLDTIGVFARDVADAALFSGVLTGRAPSIPVATGLPRILLCPTPAADRADAAALATLDAAAALLARKGANVVERPLPEPFGGLYAAQTEIMAVEAAVALSHEVACHATQLSAPLRQLIASADSVAPERYDADLQLAQRCRGAFDTFLGDADVLMTLSALGEAPEGLTATGDPICGRLWTLLGVPCLHLPFGVGPRGLPLGVQLVARYGEDERLLAVGEALSGVLRRV
ncbi:amidase [uncultured Propionivibrio sp.]|uniref:amidase n=1 Tax=uncultured Propionivibrio sp. TaxID=426737 RepID=UPI0029C020FC|nr:amidase [uncultured Propionivibrio sp.]